MYGLECGLHYFKDVWKRESLHHDHNVIGKNYYLTFASLESRFIRSLMTIFDKVGPQTDPWGQPMVTRFQLREFPSVTWTVRSRKKSFTMLNMLGGHFSFLSRARIPGCKRCRNLPLCPEPGGSI